MGKETALSDSHKAFVTQTGFVPQKELRANLVTSNLFVFVSSCQNMPVSLLEAMAFGLPITCSNRDPVPEIHADGGVCFDSGKPGSIAAAAEQLTTESALREGVGRRAKQLSEQYSWSRCAEETWKFIGETYSSVRV